MRADRVYRVLHTRGGPAPALIAEPDRIDVIEVVEIESGEVVLLWDAVPRDAKQLLRRVQADLQALEADEFIANWSVAEPPLEQL
jgi:hypothetical protein